MKTHISLNVRDVQASIGFYQKVFGVAPQKQAGDYAKFDLTTPPLNFSLIAAPADLSRVNHLGIEVESAKELARWEGAFLAGSRLTLTVVMHGRARCGSPTRMEILGKSLPC
jgi:catechol 2,3-dioxygenase-like lactoylglutathione lyase family enzyme